MLKTIMVIKVLDFLMLCQIFLSRKAKRSAIISNKYGIYMLPHKLPNDVDLGS